MDLDLENKTFLYPTDTTFGLGCDAKNVDAIRKIQQLKNRSDAKSFVILVDSVRMLQSIVDVPVLAWDLMDLSEKPITIVYDNPRGMPKELVAADNTIAIRLTNDLFCKKLISKLNSPIVSTSANLSGEPSPTDFESISAKIKEGVDYIFSVCVNFKPQYQASSIIKLSEDSQVKVIREYFIAIIK